ncbi:uncharacterized protein J3D65DRAFT_644084 [Phyllosticta citribraziliensis]|uniref:GPR1/FUN34/YaaH-class plasma membrane protein n=1 Tax=Phyllosticta citribraziliensis TaxID=989973 RepID=A0ABR1M564_9PEZI
MAENNQNHVVEEHLEKDFSRNDYPDEHLGAHVDADHALNKIRTAGSISISPELFEKIYLSPQNRVKGELRRTCLIGFLLALTPLSCILMGWRGASGASANVGAYYFCGGVLMLLGAIGEWILGNSFPCVVFASFGGFWTSFGATLTPDFNAYGAFATDPSNPASGLQTVGFNSGFGFLMLSMAFMCFLFTILALRTNLCFVTILGTLCLLFCMLAGAYWQTSNGNLDTARHLQKAGGAFSFITICAGWWVMFAILLVAIDFPFQLPVGDLSHIIKGKSEKRKAAGNVV